MNQNQNGAALSAVEVKLARDFGAMVARASAAEQTVAAQSALLAECREALQWANDELESIRFRAIAKSPDGTSHLDEVCAHTRALLAKLENH